jgi:hypothetical protein
VGDCVAPRRIVDGARSAEGSRGMDEEAPKDAVGVRAGAAEVAHGRQFVGDREPE